MSMAVIHISEADAARDFAGLMAHVRAGAEIVIESDAAPVSMPSQGCFVDGRTFVPSGHS